MRHRQRLWFVTVVVLYSTVAAGAVSAAEPVFSFELFVTLSIAGFVTAVEATAPSWYSPRWHVRLRWMAAAGILVFTLFSMRYVGGLIS